MDKDNHALMFIKSYWGMILVCLTTAGILITMWFELQFVIKAVNPDSVTEFRVEEAILSTKREMRWCLGKLIVTDDFTKKQILSCAD